MKNLTKLLALLTLSFALLMPAKGQVDIQFGRPYYPVAPACQYGYFDTYPYACAPYGYYGPTWFNNGVFIGVGPWFGGHYHYGYRPYFGHYDYNSRNHIQWRSERGINNYHGQGLYGGHGRR